MNRTKPTIVDVARRAKVSVGTVSHVLNGKVPVSDQRRSRVQEAIEQLGYSQNPLAAGLRGRRPPIVGLCVPHTSVAYFAALVDAFEEVAADRGFKIIQVMTQLEPDHEFERVRALLHYNVSGVILLPSIQPDRTLKALARSGTPTVIVDRPTEAHLFDEVTFDNRGAMFEVTRRLIALGHRRIALIITQPKLSTTRHRIQGLREAVEEMRGVTAQVIESGGDEISLTSRLASLFQDKDAPTAFVAANNTIAAWLLRSLRSLAVRAPTDVSVMAFGEPEWADLTTPQLSVVRQPTGEIARTAWELLIRRMNGDAAPVQRIELKAELIMRDSVAPYLPRPGDPPGRVRAKPRATSRR
jgi:LacI family transcriptional regulator